MSTPRAPADNVRWMIAPDDGAQELQTLIASLRGYRRGDAAPTAVAPWTLISSAGARLVLRREAGTEFHYCKWFGFDRVSWRRRSGLAIWPTPAARHVRWVQRLGALGVRLVRTVAAGELDAPGLLRQPASLVVTCSPRSAMTLDRAASEGTLSVAQRERLLAEVDDLARRLHGRGIGRLDLRAKNLLIYSPDGPIALFDLDRLVQLGPFGRWGRVRKDFERVAAVRRLLLAGNASPSSRPASETLQPPRVTPMTKSTPAYVARSLYDQPGYARQYDTTRYQDDPAKTRRDEQTRRAIAEALAKLESVKAILDLPCGTGRLSGQMVEAGYAYTGVDLSPSMLEVAKEKWAARPEIRFMQADGEALPFAADEFDAIVCVRFLNLVPSEPRRRILAEMRRVSRRYLVIASGYFRKHDFLLPVLAPVVPGFAKRLRENRELHEDLKATGWRESFWVPYKSRGLLSTTKMIGVFEK